MECGRKTRRTSNRGMVGLVALLALAYSPLFAWGEETARTGPSGERSSAGPRSGKVDLDQPASATNTPTQTASEDPETGEDGEKKGPSWWDRVRAQVIL